MSSTEVLLAIATCTFVFWFVRDRVRNAERNRLLDKLRKLPVPRFPLIGHLWYCLGSAQRFFRLLNEATARLGPPFVLWFGIVPSVHLTRVEDMEDVSKKCTNKNTYGIVEGTLEDGIIAQNHEKWRRTRRFMTPAFGIVMLTQDLHVFDEQSKVLVDLLQQKATEGETFDLWPFLINANIDIITKNMMGVQPDCQKNQGNEYSEAFVKLLDASLCRLLNPLLYPDFVFKIYSYLNGLTHYIKTLHEYPNEVIRTGLENKDNIIEYRERTSLSSVNSIPKHMIDILLFHHISDPITMTEKQIGKEMIHLIAAGSETTAVSIGFLMMMYGMHPDEQETAYQEIKRIVPDDRPISMEDLNQFEYLDQTIKETLRFFSIVPVTYRTLQHALTLPCGDTIPEGVDVFLHWKCVHENPSYYPNPKKWNPKNFDAEAVKVRPPNSFVPFGLGSRACLGYKYAMLSMKVQASHLLRKYHVSTDTKLEDIVVDQDLLRRSRHGYLVKLRNRDS